jgi:hypothetical protein
MVVEQSHCCGKAGHQHCHANDRSVVLFGLFNLAVHQLVDTNSSCEKADVWTALHKRATIAGAGAY